MRPTLRLLLLPVEWLFHRLTRSRPIPGSRQTFLIALHPWHGRPLTLRDGTTVRHGDAVAEIHFWNVHLAGYRAADTRDLTWQLLRDMRADLGALAAHLAAMPQAGRPGAIFGVSPLAHGAARMGFEAHPLPGGPTRSILTFWQGRVLARTFRAVGRGRRTDSSGELWMSYAELQRRYGAGASAPAAAEGGSRPRTREDSGAGGPQAGPARASGPPT